MVATLSWLFTVRASANCTADSAKPFNLSLLIQGELTGGNDSVSCVIPFSRAGNLILLRATSDTTDGNFIFDTGAPGLVLNITYFRNYTMLHSDDEQLGITGEVSETAKTIVNKMVIGCLNNERITADLANLGHLENVKGIKILGLLGWSLFRQCEIIIDYDASLLYLHRIGKKEQANYQHALLNDTANYSSISIEIWNNKILTTTYLNGKKLKLNIDSGAETNLLDSRLPGVIFNNVEIIRRISLNGAGNKKVEALYGNLSNLTIGNRNTGSMPVIITNLEKTCLGVNSCIDGVLGFDFLSLHKIGFNFVKNTMFIWK